MARRVELKDPRAGNFERDHQSPSYVTAKPGEAEALDLLMKITGSGSTSRIYKKLVVELKLASSAGGDYSGYGLDGGTISLYAVAADGVPLAKVELAIDDVLAEVAKNGVTAAELARAKASYLADYVYDSDNQATLARRYGWSLAVGRTVADVEAWPDNISKVTADDVKKVAAQYLDLRRFGDRLSHPGPDRRRASRRSAALPRPWRTEVILMNCSTRGIGPAVQVVARFNLAIVIFALALLFNLSSSRQAAAMNIQTIKSPGGIERVARRRAQRPADLAALCVPTAATVRILPARKASRISSPP